MCAAAKRRRTPSTVTWRRGAGESVVMAVGTSAMRKRGQSVDCPRSYALSFGEERGVPRSALDVQAGEQLLDVAGAHLHALAGLGQAVLHRLALRVAVDEADRNALAAHEGDGGVAVAGVVRVRHREGGGLD